MDFSGSLDGGRAGRHGPGATLVFADGQEADELQRVVTRADQAVARGRVQAQIGQELRPLVGRQFGEFLLDPRRQLYAGTAPHLVGPRRGGLVLAAVQHDENGLLRQEGETANELVFGIGGDGRGDGLLVLKSRAKPLHQLQLALLLVLLARGLAHRDLELDHAIGHLLEVREDHLVEQFGHVGGRVHPVAVGGHGFAVKATDDEDEHVALPHGRPVRPGAAASGGVGQVESGQIEELQFSRRGLLGVVVFGQPAKSRVRHLDDGKVRLVGPVQVHAASGRRGDRGKQGALSGRRRSDQCHTHLLLTSSLSADSPGRPRGAPRTLSSNSASSVSNILAATRGA